MIKSFKEFCSKFNKHEKKEFSIEGKNVLWKIYKEEYSDDDDNEGIDLSSYAEYSSYEELKKEYGMSDKEIENDLEIYKTKKGSFIVYL